MIPYDNNINVIQIVHVSYFDLRFPSLEELTVSVSNWKMSPLRLSILHLFNHTLQFIHTQVNLHTSFILKFNLFFIDPPQKANIF